MTKTHYTVVDLFAGCGGLSLGLENAGFRPIFVSELDNDARKTYTQNRTFRLGGRKFSEFDELHADDVKALKGSGRLAELRGIWRDLPEVDFRTSGPRRDSTLDLVAGGPPCQGYSGIGHRRSYAVEKQDIPSNRLFESMVDVISDLRPRLFLFENVAGLKSGRWTASGRRGEIFDDVLAKFCEDRSYVVRHSLVRARDYGVPQNRPRVLIVGIRKDIAGAATRAGVLHPDRDEFDAVECGFLPPRLEGRSYPDLVDLLGDLVDDRITECLRKQSFFEPFETAEYRHGPASSIQKHLRRPRRCDETGKKLPAAPLTDHAYSKHSKKIVDKFWEMLRGDGSIPEGYRTKKFAQRVLPREWGAAGPTITATSLPDDYVHFSQPRSLTVREWARLQLFPDWYQFAGKRTTGGLRRAGNPREGVFDRELPKYTQIGNAVPVGLAEHVGAHFGTILEKAGAGI